MGWKQKVNLPAANRSGPGARWCLVSTRLGDVATASDWHLTSIRMAV